MWCNLIRRKIRLHLSDQEIRSNQIKLTRTKRIIFSFMPMFHDIISCSLFLFLFISFYFVLFLSSIFHCFLSPSDFFLFFSSPSASPSLCSQHYPLLSLHGFSYSLPLASQNSWIDFQNCNILKITFFFHIRKYSPSFHYFVQKLSFL